eukprot:PhM_4_TR7531/c1_g1_i3/m.28143
MCTIINHSNANNNNNNNKNNSTMKHKFREVFISCIIVVFAIFCVEMFFFSKTSNHDDPTAPTVPPVASSSSGSKKEEELHKITNDHKQKQKVVVVDQIKTSNDSSYDPTPPQPTPPPPLPRSATDDFLARVSTLPTSVDFGVEDPPPTLIGNVTVDTSFAFYNFTMAAPACVGSSSRKTFFDDVLLVLMISPSRTQLVYDVVRHYCAAFPYMVLLGPNNAVVVDNNDNSNGLPSSLRILGFDVVWGNEQYRALRSYMRMFFVPKQFNYDERRIVFPFAGFLWLADDLMLHYWSLTGLDKDKIWSSQLGIASLKTAKRMVNAPASMSYEKQLRRNWPFYKKSRSKMMRLLVNYTELKHRLYEAAIRTPQSVFYESHYLPFRQIRTNKRTYFSYSMFFAIMDAYYMPARFIPAYLRYCKGLADVWVQQEAGLGTILAALSAGDYERLNINYYWLGTTAQCIRPGWSRELHGFHRCRHDNKFAKNLFKTEANRWRQGAR